ncbi:MAG: TOBE domain-containing protein [Campylobacterales bacterium]|nr:TOBE domain-containing protein [Campylobacterales bacterium]
MDLDLELKLSTNEKSFYIEKFIALIEAIKECGSILKATQMAEISYKNGWDILNIMNNQFSKKIFETETGGKNGGGTKITPFGEKVLSFYKALIKEREFFIDFMSKQLDLDKEELYFIQRRFSMMISARNQLHGKIIDIKEGAVNVETVLELKSGDKIYALITKDAKDEMNLSLNQAGVAIFKASSVLLTHDENIKISARNKIAGTISKIIEGAVNVEVILDINDEVKIFAIITKEALSELDLKVGQKAIAIIKTSSLMIGV